MPRLRRRKIVAIHKEDAFGRDKKDFYRLINKTGRWKRKATCWDTYPIPEVAGYESGEFILDNGKICHFYAISTISI